MKEQDELYFWLLELLVWWEGRCSPAQLMSAWQISRQHASKLFREYRQQYPQALEYQAADKAYHPTEAFWPRRITGDVSEYLNWVTQRTRSLCSPASTPLLPHEILRHPPRQVTPALMRPLVRAIRENRRLDVSYISLSNPDHDGRILVPHHFVNNGQRWHLRAWCEKSQAFRDFVLSRFRGEPDLMDVSVITAEQDEAWNTQIDLVLEPDPRLSLQQKQVIEQDYSMVNGQLLITTRACLVNYLLKSLQVHSRILEGEPEAQQLVLVNKHDIQQWLFD